MVNQQLITKIKKALEQSGFPLELKISKWLDNNGWISALSSYYEDFETEKMREIDILAYKRINGISINLNIECKKSVNKQLILYAQNNKASIFDLGNIFRCFPYFDSKRSYNDAKGRVLDAFKDLPVLNKDELFSNSIIFTKGDKVEQNNDLFFKSLNGIIKKSIVDVSQDNSELGPRTIYLHIVVYDGFIFFLQHNETEDFSLEKTDYGQYAFEYKFNMNTNNLAIDEQIKEGIKHFTGTNIIEIMTPDYFNRYIKRLEEIISGVDTSNLDGWGSNLELNL